MDQLKRHIHFPEVRAHHQHHKVLSLLNVLQSYSDLENLEAQLRSYRPLLSSSVDSLMGMKRRKNMNMKAFQEDQLPSPPLAAHHLRPKPHDYLNSPDLAAVYANNTSQGTR